MGRIGRIYQLAAHVCKDSADVGRIVGCLGRMVGCTGRIVGRIGRKAGLIVGRIGRIGRLRRIYQPSTSRRQTARAELM
jgi:hypothetical protein